MTESQGRAKEARGNLLKGGASILLICAVLCAAIFLADDLGVYVGEGARLVIERVLPSAVPFMMISGFAAVHIHPESLPRLSRLFEKIFAVSSRGFGCFLIGNLTGFPIGGRLCADLRLSGGISEDDAERLIAISNNPSPSFVTAAVGIGLFGDLKIGIILLSSVWIGTMLSAQLTRTKTSNIIFDEDIQEQKYNFIESVKSCALSCLYMSGFIIIFSVIIGVVKDALPDSLLKTAVITLTELTGAVSYILSCYPPREAATVALAAFALGFGGLSVLFQVSAFANEANISMKKYLLLKLCEGCFAAAIAFCISRLYFSFT